MIKIILDTYGVHLEIEENNQKQFKFLSFPKFQQLILQQYSLNSGLLPLGTIAYKKNGYTESVAILESPKIRTVKYEMSIENAGKTETKIKSFRIPLPPFLFIVNLDLSKRIKNVKVYALKNLFLTHNSLLYHAPFSNTHNDGIICFGDGDKLIDKPFKHLAGLRSIIEIFFLQPFNKDLDRGLDDGNEPTLEFFKKYNGKKQFPLSILKPYKKFSEVWQENNEI